ncbi:MAG: hypothetical protein AAF928_05015 [Myxococcota bacterium]
MSDPPRSSRSSRSPRHPGGTTQKIPQVPASAPLPFSPPKPGSPPPRPSAPPPTSERVFDEETSDLNEPRATAAMPIIRVPDLSPGWVHPQAGSEDGAPVAAPTTQAIELPLVPAPRRRPEVTSLETYAALRAMLDHRPADRENILRDADLEHPEWEAVEAHWTEELQRSARRGEDAQLVTFDRAYVAQLDRERDQPYELKDYAALDAATEQGRADEKLKAQSVPAAAKMILRRHWLRAIMESDAVRDRYYAELDRSRGGS